MAKYKFRLVENKNSKDEIKTFLENSLSVDETNKGLEKLINEFLSKNSPSLLIENNKNNILENFKKFKSSRLKDFYEEWKLKSNQFEIDLNNLINAYNKKHGL